MRLIEGFWSGEPCYVVGGGPSLKDFEWNLLRGGTVKAAHELGPDIQLSAKHNIIVVNRAWKDLPNADIFFTEDARCITDLWGATPEWKAFRGLKVLHVLDPSFEEAALKVDPTLTIIRRVRKDKYWSNSLSDGLALSSNSGVGALNLACLLGADPIYLLGFDCRAGDNDRMANYHNDYPEDWQTSGAQANSFKSDFEHWVALHTKNRTVINLCDERFMSRIDCWPKWDRDNFLRNGTPRWRIYPER